MLCEVLYSYSGLINLLYEIMCGKLNSTMKRVCEFLQLNYQVVSVDLYSTIIRLCIKVSKLYYQVGSLQQNNKRGSLQHNNKAMYQSFKVLLSGCVCGSVRHNDEFMCDFLQPDYQNKVVFPQRDIIAS
jgi:hypothetical protein